MLDPNNRLLIERLEATPLLDGRFRNIRVVNCNLATGTKRGCFSVVFRADDVIEGKVVALKFYDVSPASLNDEYRLSAFRRESAILEALLTADRCLQLVAGLKSYPLAVDVPNYGVIELPCQYFAVEWLDTQVDEYFLAQQDVSAIEKLRLFNEIILAVEALHRREIFHRDLKADNLRATTDATRRMVVAIDLGTAARLDSAFSRVAYGGPVGAQGYAPPEAICGLAGNRRIAPLSDVYALGCLLFELFNPDHFYYATRSANAQLELRLAAMRLYVTEHRDDDLQLGQWQKALQAFGQGIAPVRLDGPASTLPMGIASLLNEVLSRLTDFNYSRRVGCLPWARRVVWTAIRVLENENEYQRRLAEVKRRRQWREERAARRRLRALPQPGGTPQC